MHEESNLRLINISIMLLNKMRTAVFGVWISPSQHPRLLSRSLLLLCCDTVPIHPWVHNWFIYPHRHMLFYHSGSEFPFSFLGLCDFFHPFWISISAMHAEEKSVLHLIQLFCVFGAGQEVSHFCLVHHTGWKSPFINLYAFQSLKATPHAKDHQGRSFSQ